MLTAEVITAATPLVLGTLIKHYIARRSVTKDSKARDDLVFDEVFVLLKTFMEISSKHTVEDLQRLTLTTAPSPPYVLIHRLLIPLETCHDAAQYLIQGLGGEDMARTMVGGTKWWQVRGLKGVEAEWIGIKKDWRADEARRKEEDRENPSESNGEFRPEMDHLRCMLYIHGGAYYWGSINTHRYSIWRYARKMKGRCFAVNYRKSPQYPFPCAIQDCLAAYLYLLHPPPGAKHRPIDPKNLVIAGDSAGGGLVLALLQIIRDTGLAMPAGAVLISPWSDLTHSFPSILENTATDIVPPYGFIHRPSTLWPPPPPELMREMQKTLRTRVKEGIDRLRLSRHNSADAVTESAATASRTHEFGNVSLVEASDGIDNPDVSKLNEKTLYPVQDTGDLHHHPGPRTEPNKENPSRADPTLLSLPGNKGEDTLMLDVNGETVTIKSQIQLYCTNAQLTHPLVSPAMGYLGGLCPLMVIAGDKEVLRDEIIYVAHKAAHPDRYPLKESIRMLQPCLEGIEAKFGPTEVHLQVYDEVCHVLPLLSMTKPARGCYRAIASFARYVTAAAPASRQPSNPTSDQGSKSSRTRSAPTFFGLPHTSQPSTYHAPPSLTEIVTTPPSPTLGGPLAPETPTPLSPAESPTTNRTPFFTPTSTPSASPLERQVHHRGSTGDALSTAQSSPAISRRSSFVSVVSSAFEDRPSDEDKPGEDDDVSKPHAQPAREVTGDDAGPRFGGDEEQERRAAPGTAGHPGVYRPSNHGSPYTDSMIRERVAMDGVCRPLEPEEEIGPLHLPLDQIGVIKEGAAMRYVTGQALWDKKYHRDTKRIAKRRAKHLANADKKDAHTIREYWEKKAGPVEAGHKDHPDLEDLLFDKNWTWTWAFEGEKPPPSCIVSRRDFSEARTLARMADRLDDDSANSHAVNLWVALASFFSSSTMRDSEKQGQADKKLDKIEEKIRDEARRRSSIAQPVQPSESTPLSSGQNTPSKPGFRKFSSMLKSGK